MRKLLLSFSIFFSLTFFSKIQGQDVSDVLSTGLDATSDYLGAYMKPLGETIGINMNSGWINAGHPMGLGRFELRVTVPMTFVPEDMQTFDVNALPGWSGPDDAPTFLSGTGSTDDVSYNGSEIASAPKGIIGFNPLPPNFQLSVGLIKKTEIMIRYIPTLSFGRIETGLWGVGVKHDIGQWIPVVKKLPFTISTSFAYSQMDFSYDLEEIPGNDSDANNQFIVLDGSGWNLGLQVSKKIPFLTAYLGGRYMSSNVSLLLEGDYDFDGEEFSDEELQDFEFSQFGAFAGFRLKLGVITIFAEGLISKYPTVSTGLGIGFID